MTRLPLSISVLVSLLFLASCNWESHLYEEASVSGKRELHRSDRMRTAPDKHSSSVSSDNLTTDSGYRVPLVEDSDASIAPPSIQPPTRMSSWVSSSPENPVVTLTQEKNLEKSITYTTDHGKERVTVNFSITMDDVGNITTLSALPVSADRESRQYISRFNSAAKSQIIGKKISSLSLSAVWWASDTTDAFVQIIKSL